MLNGNPLTWVDAGKHLGTKLVCTPCSILNEDIKEKRAQYIQRNNELMQEFSFADTATKVKINSIFNSHFTGSVLWDLFGKEAKMIFNTWNTSIRKIFRLDRTTHRYFIEPISHVSHIKISLMKRFMKFTEKLTSSSKRSTRNIFNIIKHDYRSITGWNMRNIMQYCGKNRIHETTPNAVSKKCYRPIPIQEMWRVNILEELLEIRDNINDSAGWNRQEIADCIRYLCTT